MKRIIRLKINRDKIDEARLFKGSKGTYLDATVFLDGARTHTSRWPRI